MPQELVSAISPSSPEVNSAVAEIIKIACKKIGMGLEDYLVAVRDGLKASIDIRDRDGDIIGNIPNHNIRLKAAQQGLIIEGYMNSPNSMPVDNSKHLHQTYVWITDKSASNPISTSRIPGDDSLSSGEISSS